MQYDKVKYSAAGNQCFFITDFSLRMMLSNSLITVVLLRHLHCRLEEATGLAFRFIIGKSNSKNKMAVLEREVEEYDDFVLLDIQEEYSRLPYKT
jgi:hypothetical protein